MESLLNVWINSRMLSLCRLYGARTITQSDSLGLEIHQTAEKLEDKINLW